MGNVNGLDRLINRYGSLEAAVNAGAKKAVSQGAKLAQSGAVLLCPVNDGELRQSIKTKVVAEEDRVVGTVYTNKKYAVFVELGTGPVGSANHEGISPEVTPVYTQSPWWIHESQIDERTAEKYHWFHIDTPNGRFYQCSGQAAQPFLYPGLKNTEDIICRTVNQVIKEEIRKICK